MSSRGPAAAATGGTARPKADRGAWFEEEELAPPCILLAEDDLEMRRYCAGLLRRAGYGVIEACNGSELLELLTDGLVNRNRRAPFDLVISDHRMPGRSGLGVLEGLRQFEGAPPFIMITAFGGAEFAVDASRAGARAVLDKPFESLELLQIVGSLIGPGRS